MAIATRAKEALTNVFASPKLSSAKFFPKSLGRPVGIPMVTMAVKMVASEMTDDEVPITSGVVILAMTSQKTYPPIMEIIVSLYRYMAPFPIVCLSNLVHPFYIYTKFLYQVKSWNNVCVIKVLFLSVEHCKFLSLINGDLDIF